MDGKIQFTDKIKKPVSIVKTTYELVVIDGLEQYQDYKRENRLAITDVLVAALVYKGGMTSEEYDKHLVERMKGNGSAIKPENLKFFLLLDPNQQDGSIMAAAMGWHFGTIKNGPRLLIQSLAVSDDYRGQGMGQATLRMLQKYCIEAGYKGYDISVSKESLQSTSKFYEAIGSIPKTVLFSVDNDNKVSKPSYSALEEQKKTMQTLANIFDQTRELERARL
jgi:ribosomal protein S18 acetylase RimI-like enzyme